MRQRENSLENWLAVLTHSGIGPVKFKKILLEDPELITLPKFIRPDREKIAKALKWLDIDGNHIITIADATYPPQLKKIYDPPPLLFVQGQLLALKNAQLAIVGSRNASNYGMQVAENFASHFAKLGISITSGLAFGIDAASHRGALNGGIAPTIAVVANGLDIIYPPEHKNLSEEICLHGGAIVSENIPGTKPLAGLFPRRNRIISGLSLGVLVVEATCNSGSLITASMALEQGREEGCLSFPGVFAKVTRHKHITVKYLDINGRENTIEAAELLAICIQHEIDHLNGITFFDHLSSAKKVLIKNKLAKLRKKIL